ncbi:hypothetical protein POM88_017880 [Heracleum sosnowskyi]|uniref:Uncharacterized protein n=1 Tax=Heracleum sosnowskyi TaxID=360622 RepID=A0AAD8MYP7_9APIA|nr:hypothetical protein POM88_017880 [Heracleum sosnowskyi]
MLGEVLTLLMLTRTFLSFLHLEDYAKIYNYSKYDFLYFQSDGYTFSMGLRLLYDDESFRSMISLCFPYKKINLFVDHEKRFETANLPPISYKFLDVSGKDDEVGGNVVDTGEAQLFIDNIEDSDYED